MIRVESLSKHYDNAKAVRDLSFVVEPGQVLGLVGRNGAGKTTTLKSIAGIIPASGGQLYVGEHSLAADPIAVKQRSAYVPDDPELFNDLTVEDHLVFTASIYGVDDPWNEIDKLLAMFELTEKRFTPASGLSRGMRQKLAIICAYLQRPAALLLDEPMTGLDPQGIRKLKESVAEQAKRGAAVIISSHLLAMVEDICTDVLILEKGQCKFFGPLDKLKQQFGGTSDETRTLEEIYFATIDLQLPSSEQPVEPAQLVSDEG
jgi:ABC-2 type transport system ATP-binding protein